MELRFGAAFVLLGIGLAALAADRSSVILIVSGLLAVVGTAMTADAVGVRLR